MAATGVAVGAAFERGVVRGNDGNAEELDALEARGGGEFLILDF